MTELSGVPTYKLYGEKEQWPTPDMVHCESIAARSKLHNWQIRPHQHNGLFQILFLEGGKAMVQVDDVQRRMVAGQLLMVPQMCVHGFQFEHNAIGHVVTLAYPLIHKLVGQAGDGLLGMTNPQLHMLKRDEDGQQLKTAFTALASEYKGGAAFRNQLVESLLGMILLRLARSALPSTSERPRETGRAGEHFGNFCQLIEDNFTQHQPLAWYAKKLGITAAHLNVLCRQTVGKSALELIHERMVLEAKRNLIYTSMTISVVSYTIGFSDPAYFTRFFKRQVGMSPKDFRRHAGT
jgi:AraC family transcriptional regulator, transcriptional activator of pobA